MYQFKNWKLICEEKDREIARLKEELERVKRMERLTYKNNLGEPYLEYGADAIWSKCEAYDVLKNAITKIAHYEDLEEQGFLLKLPCKVGDTIYLLDYEERKMDEATVQEIMIDSEGLFINTDYANYLHTKLEYVFLTKAEAVKALAEMEK